MELIESNIQVCKFAFLKKNRKVEKNNDLKESIKTLGVQNPIMVIPAAQIPLDEELYMADCPTQLVKDSERHEYLAILDGQHRYTIVRELVESEKVKMEKAKRELEIWSKLSDEAKKKREKPLEYTPKITPNIHVIVKNIEEIKSINEAISSINSTSKVWKDKDYINNAYQCRAEDNIVKTVNSFKNLGFSMSSISRFMCFNKSYLTSMTLLDYVNNGTQIRYINYDRAIRLYQYLLGKGFTNKFLKKRYLIDLIIEEKAQHDDINVFLNRIEYLRRADAISNLKDKDCSNIAEEIRRIINEDYLKTLDEEIDSDWKAKIEKVKDYLSLVADDDVIAFLDNKDQREGKVKNNTNKKDKSENKTTIKDNHEKNLDNSNENLFDSECTAITPPTPTSIMKPNTTNIIDAEYIEIQPQS